MNASAGQDEARLRPSDRRVIVACLATTLLALFLLYALYPRAFPEASIDVAVDRATSRARAAAWRDALGCATDGALHAARFTYDTETKTYLEREVGLARGDAAVASAVRLWRWGHRWFRPGELEEVRIEVATTGELAHFECRRAEDAPGAALAPAEARRRALEFLATCAAIDTTRLQPAGRQQVLQPQRIDHAFAWEWRARRWGEAPLRLEVVLHGDQIGRFSYGLDLPEAWRRAYAALRSRNETTGTAASVLYGLLLLAVAVAFVRRLLRGDIRGRVAWGFAAAAGLLWLLSQANGMDAWLYEYSPAQSLGGFLLQRVTAVLLQSLGLALFVFVLTAGAEAVYRGAYPDHLALEGIFTRRGLRTRRFLVATVVGYALAAGFCAYQALFYWVGGHLGAWVPADVPYDDLLTTRLPWAFVLMVGFTPAVTEEFSARMFALPALTRWLRWRWLALLLAAAIWGFGHAAYPNQPFYIRGVEVGLAGIAVGLAMLRFGIWSVLVWHYTVDAFYAAQLLLRSGDTYLGLSGAAAAGAILLPLGIAAFAYLRTGRFVSPAGIRNRDFAAPLGAPAYAAAAGQAGDEWPEATAPSRPVARTPLRRWIGAGLLALLAALALHRLPAERWDAPGACALRADEARQRARAALAERGAPLDSLRLLLAPRAHTGAEALQHAARSADTGAAMRLTRAAGGAFVWRLRAVRSGQPREWWAEVSAGTGELVGWGKRRAETAPGATLTAPAARERIETALAEEGWAAQEWRWVAAEARERPARRDHWLAYESTAPGAHVGAARVRLTARWLGDEFGGWQRHLHLTDEARRAEAQRGLWQSLHLALLLLVLAAALGLALRRLRHGARPGAICWRAGLKVAGLLGAIMLLAAISRAPMLLADYDTEQPWTHFVIETWLLVPFEIVLTALVLGVGVAMLPALHPRIVAALRFPARRRAARDAGLTALLVAAGLGLHDQLRASTVALWPSIVPPWNWSLPPGLGGALPWLSGLAAALEGAAVAALAIGLVLYLLPRQGAARWPRLGMLLLATALAVAPETRTWEAFVAAWLPHLLLGAAALAAATRLVRANVAAYGAAALVLGAYAPVAQLARHPATRMDAAVLVLILALAFAALLAFPVEKLMPRAPRRLGAAALDR